MSTSPSTASVLRSPSKDISGTRDRTALSVDQSRSNDTNGTNDVSGTSPTGGFVNGAGSTVSSTAAGEPRWTGLDMSGATLRNLSPSLFRYTFLTQLRLNNNQLVSIPSAIGLLRSLLLLDVGSNRLRSIPPEICMCFQLHELILSNNQLTSLPWEVGSLSQLEVLRLDNNILQEPFLSLKDSPAQTIVQYLREHAPMPTPPQDRPWIPLAQNVNEQAAFTVFCMNILSDKYATPQVYGYCPSWALAWDYRKEAILQEILHNNTDIVCLQEVESSQFFDFFQPELSRQGQYKGIYRPKSRAKTMTEEDGRSVDGCAIFFKPKFAFVSEAMIEFQQAHCRPELRNFSDFFNRIMPKDNIAIIVALRHLPTNETIIVANPHMTWDPQYADVKLVQTALLMDELSKLLRRGHFGSSRDALPMIICGDFNSLPASSVYKYMSAGLLPKSAHTDFDGHSYGPYTEEDLKHRFRLSSAYGQIGELPFTNYTPTFSGTIDYIWYSSDRLSVTGLLGQVNQDYLTRQTGFPNAHFPSDHISLVAEMVFLPSSSGGSSNAPSAIGQSLSSGTNGMRSQFGGFSGKP